MEENKNIHNVDEFIEALKKNPWDFNDNEIYEESEDIIDYSSRKFTGFIKMEDQTIEQTFCNYFDALNWVEENEDKYIDEGIIRDGVEL